MQDPEGYDDHPNLAQGQGQGRGVRGRNVETEYVETWYTTDIPHAAGAGGGRATAYGENRQSTWEGGGSRYRPETGYTIDQYYNDRRDSRPDTQYTHDNPPLTASTIGGTPTTATLLPWASGGHGGQGEMPPVPAVPSAYQSGGQLNDHDQNRGYMQSQGYEDAQIGYNGGGGGGGGGGEGHDYPMLDDRPALGQAPVGPAMAKTPAPGEDRGWHGVIPPFR